MSHDATPPTARPTVQPLLELRQVTFGEHPETSLCLQQADLVVRPKDLIMVRTAASQNIRPFGSPLQGLRPPRRGQVLFQERDWTNASDRQQFSMRSRIGRVFDGQGWVANLSVHENLTLAVTHHGWDADEIDEQIQQWMQKFQLGKLTDTRPSFVADSHLQIYQWIRAFLGNPLLLILERPMRKVAFSVLNQFLAAIDELRQRGAAVIWIAGNTVDETRQTISPQHYWDLRPSNQGERS